MNESTDRSNDFSTVYQKKKKKKKKYVMAQGHISNFNVITSP